MTKQADKKQVVKRDAEPLSPQTADVNQLIAQAIDKNVNVETMEKLLAMRRELKTEWAREQYQEALAGFQADCPVIKKEKIVKNRDGTERYRYAPLESIVSQVQKLLEKHGFNYRVEASLEGKFVTAHTVLTHRNGHSETSTFTVPIDSDAHMTVSQQYASALTFTKRYSFVDVLGILTGDSESPPVTVAEPRTESSRGHGRTVPYEERTGEDKPKVAADLVELEAFLAEHQIPDGFLLRLLQEKKLLDGHTKNLAQIKPGILRRCLDEKSKTRLLEAWKAQQADEESGSATPPPRKEEPHPFDSKPVTPPAKKAPARKTAAARREPEDQRRTRQFVMAADMSATAYLEQEGVEDWRKVKIHFGEKSGTPLGKLGRASVEWWIVNWEAKPYKGTWEEDTLLLDAALCVASEEFDNA